MLETQIYHDILQFSYSYFTKTSKANNCKVFGYPFTSKSHSLSFQICLQNNIQGVFCNTVLIMPIIKRHCNTAPQVLILCQQDNKSLTVAYKPLRLRSSLDK